MVGGGRIFDRIMIILIIRVNADLLSNSLTDADVMKASGKDVDHQEMLSKVAVIRTRRQRRQVQDTPSRYFMFST